MDKFQTEQLSLAVCIVLFTALSVTSGMARLGGEHADIISNLIQFREPSAFLNVTKLVQEYESACPGTQYCGGDYAILKYNGVPKCEQCSCEPKCVLYNNCCPDSPFGYINFTKMNLNLFMNYTDFSLIPMAWFYVYQNCPRSHDDMSTSEVHTTACTNATPFDGPVTSSVTGVTYKNIDCAICNNDTNVTHWNIQAACLDTEFFFSEYNFQTFLQRAMQGDCSLLYMFNDQYTINLSESLIHLYYRSNETFIYRQCNETGLWQTFDRDIEFACTHLTSTFYFGGESIKNIFCLLCNPSMASFYYAQSNISHDNCTLISGEQEACTLSNGTLFSVLYNNLYCGKCNHTNPGGIKRHFKELYLYNNKDFVLHRFLIQFSNSVLMNYIIEHLLPVCHTDDCLQHTIDVFNTSYDTVNARERLFGLTYSFSVKEDCIWHEYFNAFYQFLIQSSPNAHVLGTDCIYDEPIFTYNCNRTFERAAELDNLPEYRISLLLHYYFCFDTENTCLLANDTCREDVEVMSSTGERTFKSLPCVLCTVFEYGPVIHFTINCSSFLNMELFHMFYDFMETAKMFCTFSLEQFGKGHNELENNFERYVSEEADHCKDIPFLEDDNCKNLHGSYVLPTLRQLFSSSTEIAGGIIDLAKSVRMSTNVASCLNDTPNTSCTDLMCTEDHVLTDGVCRHYMDINANVWFDVNLKFLTQQDSIQSYVKLDELCELLFQTIVFDIRNETNLLECKVILHGTSNCLGDIYIHIVPHHINVKFVLQVNLTRNLTHVENILVSAAGRTYTIEGETGRLVLYPEQLIPEENSTYNHQCEYTYDNYDMYDSYLLPTRYVVTKFLTCVQREFDNVSCIDSWSNNIVNTCFIHDLNKSASEKDIHLLQRDSDGGYNIRMCLEDIERVQKEDHEPSILFREPTLFESVYKYIDDTCTVISNMCYVLTFLVYLLFKPLRNTAGVNNMSLVFTLFCAQFFVKFGLWDVRNADLCVVFGALIHYFWISTFCSMNVCAFHVLKVFVLEPLTVVGTNFKLQLQYLAYTYILPAAVVSATILVHFLSSNGKHLGYGGRICFISDITTVFVAFLFPSGFIFLVNLIFFVKTFYTLRSLPILHTARKGPARNNFFIYLRLWLLLGLTWPLMMIDAALDQSIFSVLTIVASTLQGFFIFILFVCTTRVTKLFRACLCKNDIHTSL